MNTAQHQTCKYDVTRDTPPAVPATPHARDFAFGAGYLLPISLLEHMHRARGDDRQGDERALDAFLQRIHGVLRASLATRLRGLPDAEHAIWEVALEVMAKVAVGIHDCRAEGEQQLWRWVWTVAERARVDYLRRELPALSRNVSDDVEVALGGVSLQRWRESSEHEPATETQVLLRELMACYEAMPDDTAELIWHRVVLAASYEDIARALGTTVAGAKRRWQRARGALRRAVLRRVDGLAAPEQVEARNALQRHLQPAGARGAA